MFQRSSSFVFKVLVHREWNTTELERQQSVSYHDCTVHNGSVLTYAANDAQYYNWSPVHEKLSYGRGLRAISGLNCELYRRCLSSYTGSKVAAAVPPCILVISCSERCLSCCSRRSRSALNSSIVLPFGRVSVSDLYRRWLWCELCT